MKERPILFSGSMVRAILDGRKTQTRRVVTVPWHKGSRCAPYEPYYAEEDGVLMCMDDGGGWFPMVNQYRHGRPGDRLWVRETWKPDETPDEGHDEIGDAVGDHPPGIAGIRYRADDSLIHIANTEKAASRWHELLRPDETWPELAPPKWRPSIFMPREYCRLLLDVTDVRVERLQDISANDAMAEGIGQFIYRNPAKQAIPEFRELWNSINEKRGFGWDVNPWVWVIGFKPTAVGDIRND